MSDKKDLPVPVLLEASLNLYSFKRTTAFQSTVMTFMQNMLATQHELAMIARFFKQLDTNEDGYLSREEIEKGCKIVAQGSLGREPDWQSLIATIDVNQDKMIDYNEFITAASDKMKLLNRNNLRTAFTSLDLNQDGYLQPEEL